MQIVEPAVELLSITPDALQLIERAGRTAYRSEARTDDCSAAKFIERLIKAGHDSVLEHASATVRVICDRGVSHEWVRHRIASYTQESTRYCNYSSGRFGSTISVIMPLGLSADGERLWRDACVSAEAAYLKMVQAGTKPEIARSVLPTCLKTELIVTANFREWRHFFALRCDVHAHPQMQQVARMTLELLWTRVPAVFSDLRERYVTGTVATSPDLTGHSAPELL